MTDKEDAPPTTTFSPRTRGRGRGGKGSRDRREADWRKRDNKEFLEGPNAKRGRAALDKKYLPLDLPELQVAEPSQTKVSEWLAIATRGAGFMVARCYNKLFTEQPNKVLAVCSLLQAYRAVLAQVSYRLSHQRDGNPSANPDLPGDYADSYVPVDLQDVIITYGKTFSPIVTLCSGIGWFTHQDKDYQTYLPQGYPGKIIRDSAYHVMMTNLREITRALALQARPNARRFFADMNPIPGAIFSPDALLENPLDVCPDEWPNRALLRSDFDAFNALLNIAASKHPKLVGQINYSANGHALSIVSRGVTDRESAGRVLIRVDEPRDKLSVSIDSRTTWNMQEKLHSQVVIRGILSLLGEYWAANGIEPGRSISVAYSTTTYDWNAIMNHILDESR